MQSNDLPDNDLPDYPKYVITGEFRDRLHNSFTYHPPLDDQPKRYECIRNFGKTLAIAIAECAPDSRERALAITKLEEAVMWANAAIARNES